MENEQGHSWTQYHQLTRHNRHQEITSTTPVAESKEELKSLLMKEKEESERAALRLKKN